MMSETQAAATVGLLPWYAVAVRGGKENYAASLLEARDLTVYCPHYPVTSRRRGKPHIRYQPLFPGYLFCRIDLNNRMPVLGTTWVESIVATGRTPTPVDEIEIHSIRALTSHGADVRPEQPLAVGQPVMLTQGPLSGLRGVLKQVKGRYRVVVTISILQQSVSAEVDRRALLPLSTQASLSNAA